MVTVRVFPALSVAVTVKVWLPTVEVSIGEPFGTVPTHEVEARLLSVHLKFAFTTWSSLKSSPSFGRAMFAVGRSASALNATRFSVGSIRPATSKARNWTKWLPVVKPESGPGVGLEGAAVDRVR